MYGSVRKFYDAPKIFFLGNWRTLFCMFSLILCLLRLRLALSRNKGFILTMLFITIRPKVYHVRPNCFSWCHVSFLANGIFFNLLMAVVVCCPRDLRLTMTTSVNLISFYSVASLLFFLRVSTVQVIHE